MGQNELMALPASLLRAAEQHVCFSGCYGPEDTVMVCTDPARSPQRVVQVSCKDCLSFHVGAAVGLLPPHMTADQLAREVSMHVRQLRGYAWSVGGYHYACNKIWLSAAYYPCGTFLLDGSHNHDGRTDLELLIEAFRGGLVKPPDPRMMDPAQYTTQEVYLDMSAPIAPVRNKHDILRSQQCSPSFRVSARRVTIAEFLPMTTQASAPVPRVYQGALQTQNTAKVHLPDPRRRATRVGDRCPACGAIVEERPSLTETFVGCLC